MKIEVYNYFISFCKLVCWIIYHFDLYRLKSVSEFLEIGGIEYLSSQNGICIIEWPELIEGFDIDNKLKISFKSTFFPFVEFFIKSLYLFDFE